MIIKNLKINNFGKLENKEIEFANNINLIYGKNESGKSTLLKFIEGMFFGASKNKNGKNITDFERYKPWNNGEFSGKLKYILDNGNAFEIFREFEKKNPKIYNEKLEDISKTFNIDKTKGNQFFYDQTKVDEELFSSTIVSEQKEVQLDEKKQNILIQKMTNLVGTGEDNTSFNKIINKLNKKLLEEVGSSKSSDRPINIVEGRKKEIETEKEQLLIYTDAKYNIEEENKKILEDILKTEKCVENLKKIKTEKENEKIEKEKIKVNKNIQEENNKKILEIQEKLEGIESKRKTLKKEQEKEEKNLKKNIIILVIFILITLILFKCVNSVVGIISGVISIGIYIFIIIKSKNKILKKYEEHQEEINKTKTQLESEIEILENNNKEYSKNIKEIEEKIKDTVNSLENINEQLEQEQTRLNNLKLEQHKLELEKQNILPKLDNLATLEEELEDVEEKYKDLQEKGKAINLAKKYLEIAYQKIKENITPKFTKNLSENIEKISNGKYKNVKFNDEKGLIVEVENGNYIMAENLSVGTIEQLYLSLRLATIDEISDQKLPIILDETFAYFDKERLKNVLKFLSTQFKDRQVLIFTCTQREREILDELKLEYKYIEM